MYACMFAHARAKNHFASKKPLFPSKLKDKALFSLKKRVY